jgi:hypothetical protein
MAPSGSDDVLAKDRLDNNLIVPGPRPLARTQVRCRERLGGLLRYYHHAA